jgi:leucyl-tRNA synthetase
LKACRKLVEDIYEMKSKVSDEPNSDEVVTAYNKMVMKVGKMIDDLNTNTAVSEFMIFMNLAKKQEKINVDIWKGFLKTIAPFAPFITEELWQEMHGYAEFKRENSIHLQEWPKYDENLIKESKVVVGVQINGKLRAEVEVDLEENEYIVKDRVMALPNVQKWTEGAQPKKFIYVPGKIVNIVV